jgi:hypothetical protein
MVHCGDGGGDYGLLDSSIYFGMSGCNVIPKKAWSLPFIRNKIYRIALQV